MIRSGLLIASLTLAASGVNAASCNDVTLDSKYTDLQRFCTGVVSKKGADWVHLKAKVVQGNSKRLKVKFQQPDGTYSNTFKSKELPDMFRTYINGKETKLKDLRSGQKLDFFIKSEGETM